MSTESQRVFDGYDLFFILISTVLELWFIQI